MYPNSKRILRGDTPFWYNQEVIINIDIRTTGLFEVVTPVLEEGEIFNSGELKQYVTDFIKKGHRNVAIDLSGISYLYSDTINVLLSLNRMILDVNGRLSLVGPNSQVHQILESSGIYNFIKVYASDEELLRSSEEIVMQTSSYSLSALQKSAAPKSEFDDLRSEIESVMPGEATSSSAPATPQMPPPPPPPQQPFSPPPPAQSYQQPAPPPPQAPPQSYQQPFSPPPPRQSYQQPAPPPPQVPPSPSTPREDFTVRPVSQTAASRPSASPAFEPAPPHDMSSFPKTGPEEKSPPRKIDRWAEEEDDFSTKRKGFPVVSLLILIIVIGGLVAGGIFYGPTLLSLISPQQASLSPVTTPEVEEPPQLPVDDESLEDESETSEEDVEETALKEEKEEKSPVVTTRSRPRRTTTARQTPSRSTRRSAPASRAPAVTRTPVKKNNRLLITSVPSGADVVIDRKPRGKTPLRWNDPDVYGNISIEVSLDGYKKASRMVEYTGGVSEQNFTLQPKPAPVASTPAPTPQTAPAPSSSTARPSPSTPSSAPSPAAATPPPAATSQAPASTGGAPATIFISSIPPVADVYMDGKLIGKTNIAKLKVLSGTHIMKFVKGSKEHVKKMTFQPGDNPAGHVMF